MDIRKPSWKSLVDQEKSVCVGMDTTKLRERLQFVQEDESLHDVQLMVGNPEVAITTTKALLVISSDFFRTALSSRWTGSKGGLGKRSRLDEDTNDESVRYTDDGKYIIRLEDAERKICDIFLKVSLRNISGDINSKFDVQQNSFLSVYQWRSS